MATVDVLHFTHTQICNLFGFLKGLRVEKGSFGLHISFFCFFFGGGVCVSVCVWCGGWSHLWDEWLNIYFFQHVILPKDLHLIFL